MAAMTAEGNIAHTLAGEWAGWQCEFSPISGELVPLPEKLVPQEMLDWGQAPMGFEILASERLADPLTYDRRLLRLMPAATS